MNFKKMTSVLCSVVMTAGVFIVDTGSGISAEAADTQKSIATINITTYDEAYKDHPPYELRSSEGIENAYGSTLVNNPYVECTVEYVDPNGNALTFSDPLAKIKVRGNTSVIAKKLPYKLKFTEKKSFSTDDAGSKKWVLLNSGTDLKFLFSNYTSEYLGSEWQPAFEYVNLTYNGDYKGCYILVETVEQMNKDLKFDDSGFLIENDAYWWAEEEENMFKIDGIDPHVGFTYKEPEAGDLKAKQKNKIKEKMTAAAAKIMSDSDTDYLSDIDLDSAVSWFLAKDYQCNDDIAGSNMFWYASDIDAPLKLGPVWDFDRDYRENHINSWSAIHKSDFNLGKYLFEKESFQKAYRKKFEETLDLRTALPEYVNNYYNTYGASLQESWNNDAKRWQKSTLKVVERKNELLSWYDQRQKNLDRATTSWKDKIDISKATAELSAESVVYTGRPVMPALTVTYNGETLVKDKDYTFSVKDHTEPGRAMVCINGTGRFSGTLKAYYYIKPAKLTLSAESDKTGKISLSWNEDPFADGYHIQGSSSAAFDKKENYIVNDKTKFSGAFRGLTSGKTYYVRVRSFKIVGGKKIYGVSSDIISVTVK